tara:strand:- start:101 stop:355 length:255 start_codon:yes stop_codon:yes gene_type:complete
MKTVTAGSPAEGADHSQEKITAQLVTEEHGYKDFAIAGHASVHRACVPHTIQKGEYFNVYHGESSKSGCLWDGELTSSLRKFAA